MKRFSLLTGILFCLTITAYTQVSEGGIPPSFSNLTFKSYTSTVVEMPAIDYQKMLVEDGNTTGKDEPLRFAYAHQVSLNPDNAGEWYQDNVGNSYWILSISSKNAKSLNISFSDFYLPEGAKLFIYNKDRSDVKGAFTANNNKKSRQFGTAPVKGDQITLEYFEPKGTKEAYALQLETVAHDYRNVFALAKSFGASGSCNINVNCEEGTDWEEQKRSVALITLDNGTRWCTGSLINNVNNDGTPYFLTANHCLTEDVEKWVFYFNYESDSCVSIDGSLDQSISGSEVVANGESSDYLLLKLSVLPPADYKAYYAGWDASGVVPQKTIAIHHPQGDIKKISFDNDAPGISDYTSTEVDSHWEVKDWDLGTTEKGSSGSALFDENKRIIGQLHGGGAACGNDAPDFYGRFSISFPNFSSYLAKEQDVEVLDGFDPNANANCSAVDLTLTVDNYPEETTWEIKDETGKVIQSGGDYRDVTDGTTLVETFCLSPGCYTFIILDSYGDGICCGYGSGSYEVSDASGILVSGATFKESEQHTFCIGEDRQPAVISRATTDPSIAQPLHTLAVYPNPTADILNIDYKVKEESFVNISIIDFTGRVISSFTIDDDTQFHQRQLNVSDFQGGTYFIKAKENTNVMVKKFIVLN